MTDIQAKPEYQAPRGQQTEASVSRRVKILIVDDCHDVADALAMLIQLESCDVRVAYDGLDGLAVAKCFAPDIVFLDLQMPGMDGYGVARALRQTQSRQPYLVAHSALGAPQDTAKARAAGFDQYLRKPIDEATLFVVLRERRSGRSL